MRPVLTTTGAFALVLGVALIFFATFYVQTGVLRAEGSVSSTTNASTILSTYTNYAATGELISLAGVIIAPVGAAILAYGLSTGKRGEKEKQAVPSTESMQA